MKQMRNIRREQVARIRHKIIWIATQMMRRLPESRCTEPANAYGGVLFLVLSYMSLSYSDSPTFNIPLRDLCSCGDCHLWHEMFNVLLWYIKNVPGNVLNFFYIIAIVFVVTFERVSVCCKAWMCSTFVGMVVTFVILTFFTILRISTR